MLRLGILGLGEGRSTMSAALSSPHYKLVNEPGFGEILNRQRKHEPTH